MKKRKPRPKKVVESSWSADGPVSVSFEVSQGSAQMFWLRFFRKDFTALVFTNVDSAEDLHRQLGAAITAAKAELADVAAAHAAELAETGEPIPAHPNESP